MLYFVSASFEANSFNRYSYVIGVHNSDSTDTGCRLKYRRFLKIMFIMFKVNTSWIILVESNIYKYPIPSTQFETSILVILKLAVQDFISWTDREPFHVLKTDKSENW